MRVDELIRYTRAFYQAWDDAYAEELRQGLNFLAAMHPRPGEILDAIWRRIISREEDVFLSLTSLQQELLSAMPIGTECDMMAQNLAKSWLERWLHVLLMQRDFVEEPLLPAFEKIPRKALLSNQFMNERLLQRGRRIAMHPAAAQEITKALIDWGKEDHFDELRLKYVTKKIESVGASKSEEVRLAFSATAEEFRERIVATFENLGNALVFDAAISFLTGILRSEEHPEKLRAAAASALKCFPSSSSIEPLAHALENSGLAKIREEAAATLGVIGSPRAVPMLLRALEATPENGGKLRQRAAAALCRIPSEDAIDGLLTALHERNHHEVAQPERQDEPLTWARVEAGAQGIEDRFEDTRTPMTAALALAFIGSERAIDALVAAASNEEDGVFRLAMTALGDCESERAFEALSRALDIRQGRSVEARGAAADGLGFTNKDRRILWTFRRQQRKPWEFWASKKRLNRWRERSAHVDGHSNSGRRQRKRLAKSEPMGRLPRSMPPFLRAACKTSCARPFSRRWPRPPPRCRWTTFSRRWSQSAIPVSGALRRRRLGKSV